MVLRAAPIRFAVLVLLLAALVSCGLAVSFSSYDTSVPAAPDQPPLYGVRGTATGLSGAELTVRLNGVPMSIMGDGAFAFPPTLRDGASYLVSDPEIAGRTCSVEGGIGTIRGADATGVTIRCLLSNDASLSSLSISAGPLSPGFAATTYLYDVAATISAIFAPRTTTVTAKATEAGAKILIAGMAVASEAASPPIALLAGSTPIDIVVTARDGTTEKHYTLVVSPSSNDYLKASNTREQARFGSSISLAGDTLAVGAHGDSSKATGVDGNQADMMSQASAGAVHVFTRAGGVWSQQAYLKASNTRTGAFFGWAVALSATGDTLAVSASQETSNATGVNGNQADTSMANAGAVYVFTRAGGAWSQQAYIKASNTRPASFGSSLALDGDTLAVGSYVESSNATGVDGNQTDTSAIAAGAVYVFTRTGAQWSQQGYVKASNARAKAYFGLSVALSGNTMAVGASDESSNAVGVNGNEADTSAKGAGAAYVFTRAGAVWSQQAYIKASNTRVGAGFGEFIALSGDTLAVGSQAESSGARPGSETPRARWTRPQSAQGRLMFSRGPWGSGRSRRTSRHRIRARCPRSVVRSRCRVTGWWSAREANRPMRSA